MSGGYCDEEYPGDCDRFVRGLYFFPPVIHSPFSCFVGFLPCLPLAIALSDLNGLLRKELALPVTQ